MNGASTTFALADLYADIAQRLGRLRYAPIAGTLQQRKDGLYMNHLTQPGQWLLLTSEEWVRQHLLGHWLEVLMFPKGLIATERKVKRGRNWGRIDALVYDREGKPLVLAETKAATEPISQQTVMQAVTYNQTLNAQWVMVTNGCQEGVLERVGERYVQREELPGWGELVGA